MSERTFVETVHLMVPDAVGSCGESFHMSVILLVRQAKTRVKVVNTF